MDIVLSLQMFVRLFVDENLDRTVPISKQPKDKIQAILEACDRQFVEFHDRSRKRVRTYLKSCRRLKKSKDGGFEPVSKAFFFFFWGGGGGGVHLPVCVHDNSKSNEQNFLKFFMFVGLDERNK